MWLDTVVLCCEVSPCGYGVQVSVSDILLLVGLRHCTCLRPDKVEAPSVGRQCVSERRSVGLSEFVSFFVF